MGNKTKNKPKPPSYLPTFGEDVTGTIFNPEWEGLPEDMDTHIDLINQIDSVINDQKFNHHPDDFTGHEDDEQVNYEIYRQWVQAQDMLDASRALLEQAIDYGDEYGENNELVSTVYNQYTDSLRQVISFINNIPEL